MDPSETNNESTTMVTNGITNIGNVLQKGVSDVEDMVDNLLHALENVGVTPNLPVVNEKDIIKIPIQTSQYFLSDTTTAMFSIDFPNIGKCANMQFMSS